MKTDNDPEEIRSADSRADFFKPDILKDPHIEKKLREAKKQAFINLKELEGKAVWKKDTTKPRHGVSEVPVLRVTAPDSDS
jgi:hypothetical protein